MSKAKNSVSMALEAIDVDAYVSDGGIKVHYPHPKEIFSPFIERIAGLPGQVDIKVDTMKRVETREEEGQTHRAFGRMRVEAIVGSDDEWGHRGVIGKLYVFDHKNPHYIVYSGRRAMVCLNLHIMRAAQLVTVSGQDKTFGQTAADDLLDKFEQDNAEWIEHVTKLSGLSLDKNGVDRLLGSLLSKTVRKSAGISFGTEAVAGAAKLLGDRNSRYARDAEGGSDAWNVLQAITQQNTDRSYLNQEPAKALSVVSAFAEEFNV